MSETSRKNVGFALIAGTLSLAGLTVGLISCTGVPTAKPINGPQGAGNTPPTLTITEPAGTFNIARGNNFLIRWTDSDPDNNASISFDLVTTDTNVVVAIVAGLAENDQVGPDSFTVPTGIVPEANYYLRGTIDDGVNPPVETFATVGDSTERLVIRVQEPGTVGGSEPPRITITQPRFDLSVTQDDVVTVVVAPTPPPFGTGFFDRDSEFQLWIVLDTDLNPNNDDPANPTPGQIIVLDSRTVQEDTQTLDPFLLTIDLAQVPPLPNGEPYFIRATADDSLNPRVHAYAAGTLSVVLQVAGVVDLSLVGKTLSGSRWYGFNPGANLGSKTADVRDFDADGISDFVMLAQFGNPRNYGQVGEGYLVYGQDGIRFGGSIAANSVAETVDGAIFEAPPIREHFTLAEPRTNGIVDVNALPDMNGDGRPEIIFGLSLVHGAYDSTDFDPSDEAVDETETEQVELAIRNGLVTLSVEDGDPETLSESYAGLLDTTISSEAPDTSFGNSGQLTWQGGGDEGLLPRRWVLIKFSDVLEQIPDDLFTIDITTVEGSLEFRLFDLGGNGNVHEALTDFDETTTYSDYAVNLGDPEAGVDYVPGDNDEGLEAISGATRGLVTVTVDSLIQDLIDGVLSGSDDELRFIIVPDPDALDAASVRSSEFINEDDQPRLTIRYERPAVLVADDCYPDMLVNNRTDPNPPFDDTIATIPDVQLYAGGMAVIVSSTNRDNDGLIDTNRLSSTSVALELVGQRTPPSGIGASFGNIDALADNILAANAGSDPQVIDRIAGARLVAGHYDYVGFADPRGGLFGSTVGFIGDINFDDLEEIIISAPQNEAYIQDTLAANGWPVDDLIGFCFDLENQGNPDLTTLCSTDITGSIVIFPGTNYYSNFWKDFNDERAGTATIPILDQNVLHSPPFGSCTNPVAPRHLDRPLDTLEIFAEEADDFLGGAGSAGDFNLDGLDDIVAGAPHNDRGTLISTGAVYVLYTRNVLADYRLEHADDPFLRTPMIRLRGAKTRDQIGWKQISGRDVNGDRIDDVFISSPHTDFGGVTRAVCGGDFDGDGNFDQDDLRFSSFELCQQQFGNDLFLLDDCKVFDYDNDTDIDEDDRCVFCCLSNDCSPAASCIYGKTAGQCCQNVQDNGFVGVLFGGRFLDGDRDLAQLATSDLPGTIFYGGSAGDRAGMDIASAGDFNQDGFGDLLIAAPGETRVDSANRTRVGVVYLIFGGTHLENTTWDLSDPIRGVGSEDLPGIVFFSPYVAGRPNEAAPVAVAGIGDINNDGFDDIAIGNPKADFIDLTFPQGPDAPGSDAAAGRRRDAGDVYIIYGNNFGSNRGAP